MAASLGAGSMALLEMPARAAGVRARTGSSGDGWKVKAAPTVKFTSASSVHRGSVISLSPQSTRSRQPRIPPGHKRIVCATTKDLGQQIKEMQAAEKRWQSQVRDGKVKSLSAKEAGYAIDLSDFTLLDVRPTSERNRAWVKGSVWIPIFELNRHLDPGALVSKFSNFTMGGWWSGAPLMDYNGRFMPDVVSKIPKGANVIVSCQKGLRSLAACEALYKAGYRNLFWLNGGYDAVEEGDLSREGPDPFKFAGLGGVSKFLGWTDVQRQASRKEGWGYRAMLFGRLMAVVLGADLLLVGGQQLVHYIQELRQ